MDGIALKIKKKNKRTLLKVDYFEVIFSLLKVTAMSSNLANSTAISENIFRNQRKVVITIATFMITMLLVLLYSSHSREVPSTIVNEDPTDMQNHVSS